MNITLICGHYLPNLGYLEVHLARALARLGHEVSVVTTSAVPAYVAHLQKGLATGEERDGKVKVVRLKPQFKLGQVVVAKDVKAAIRSQHPDLLIVIGLGKRFPKPVFDLGIYVISLFGDNLHSYVGTSFAVRLKTKLQFALLKASTYRAAIDKSSVLVAYTPESFQAAAQMLSGRFRKKLMAQDNFISLGFDPERFFFEPALRQKEREALHIHDNEVVIITATRVVSEKKLEACIEQMALLPAHYSWLVVGADEGAYAKTFAGKALAALGPSRFRMLPFAKQDKINALYNAADIALYTVPAISVFEVLGTGLPCVLPPTPSLGHVLRHPGLSAEWTPQRDLPLSALVGQFRKGAYDRQERVATAIALFGWPFIARQLIEMATTHQSFTTFPEPEMT